MDSLKLPHRTADYLCPVNGLCDIYEWKTGKRIPEELLFFSRPGFQLISQKRAPCPKMVFFGQGSIGKDQFKYWRGLIGYNLIAGEGKSFKTTMAQVKSLFEQNIFKLLHNSLETAVDDGLIVKNVANRVRLPKVPKPKIEVLTADQQTVFVEKAKETYMGNMYVFDLCTGMRLGELLGLKWSDIDFQENQLHIERTLSKVKDPDKPDESWHLAFGAPKTPASERTIPLHDTAIKLLTDILEQQKQDKAKAGAAYEDNDLVFCTKLGRPQDPINMRRTFYRICDKAGISGLHPHCLRHTFATRGAEKQVDIRVMQRFLGHANIQETASTYTHVLGDLKRAEMQKLASVVAY